MPREKVALLVGIGWSMLVVSAGAAQSYLCEDQYKVDESLMACYRLCPEAVSPTSPTPLPPQGDFAPRYAEMAEKHKLSGLASYYSRSLDGTLTANGEIYRHKQMTAAHLTLPLGCWAEVTSRAMGRKVLVRVNDRGPYARRFILDLSQAAARTIGVDIADDRHVEIRVIAMPDEQPPAGDDGPGVSGQAAER